MAMKREGATRSMFAACVLAAASARLAGQTFPEPDHVDLDWLGNRVWEPGETVDVAPTWGNGGEGVLNLTGDGDDLFGPPGASYQIVDGTAAYSLLPLSLGSCLDEGNCYILAVDDPPVRPAKHWDTRLQEWLTGGTGVEWVLHIGESFPDVPKSNLFYAFVETIFHNGVTGGCTEDAFCPDATTFRQQMAVFVLKSKYGAGYEPPPCTGVFSDVDCQSPFAAWIEDLFVKGIVAGCGPGPVYCPAAPVSRQQMAVFLLKTMYGPAYTPPPCFGVFVDVPCDNPFAPWIEDLFYRGITAGCNGAFYCPTSPTTRGQMAPFLVKTFKLGLYEDSQFPS
jgi:hypothetical protein